MDKILLGEKTSEFKIASKFWIKRLNKARLELERLQPVNINFLCGQKSYKFIVKDIIFHSKQSSIYIDGVKTYMYYEIKLGKQMALNQGENEI